MRPSSISELPTVSKCACCGATNAACESPARRTFLRQAGIALAGIGLALPFASLFAGCATVASYSAALQDGTIAVPVAQIKEGTALIVSSDGLKYDVAVLQHGSSYEALLLQCTHRLSALTPTGTGYTCPLHGSQFDLEGHVTRGPATSPLLHLASTIKSDGTLSIAIPQQYRS